MSVRVVIPRVRVVIPLHAPRESMRYDNWQRLAQPWLHGLGFAWTVYPVPQDMTPAGGIAHARNRGAMFAQHGDVILFCDADSIVQPEAVSAGVELARSSGALVYCYREYRRLGQDETARLVSWRGSWDADCADVLWDPPSMGCVAITREAFTELGGFDEGYRIGWEDIDLASRAAPFERVDDGILCHFWHPRPAVEPEHSEWDRERFGRRMRERVVAA